MKIEDAVSLFLGTILDSAATVLPSFFHDFIGTSGQSFNLLFNSLHRFISLLVNT